MTDTPRTISLPSGTVTADNDSSYLELNGKLLDLDRATTRTRELEGQLIHTRADLREALNEVAASHQREAALRDELAAVQAAAEGGHYPVDPASGNPETWKQAVTRLHQAVLLHAEDLARARRERDGSDRRVVELETRVADLQAEAAEREAAVNRLIEQRREDGVRIESLVGELGRERQAHGETRGRLQDEERTHQAFRALVRDTAITVAHHHGWCDDGLNKTLDDLGLPPKTSKFLVPIRVDGHQIIEVEIEAATEDDAHDEATALDRHTLAEQLGHADWEIDGSFVNGDGIRPAH